MNAWIAAALVAVATWFLVSIPFAVFAGRMLAQISDDPPLSEVDDAEA